MHPTPNTTTRSPICRLSRAPRSTATTLTTSMPLCATRKRRLVNASSLALSNANSNANDGKNCSEHNSSRPRLPRRLCQATRPIPLRKLAPEIHLSHPTVGLSACFRPTAMFMRYPRLALRQTPSHYSVSCPIYCVQREPCKVAYSMQCLGPSLASHTFLKKKKDSFRSLPRVHVSICCAHGSFMR